MVWLNSCQHSPTSPAHSKGTGAGRGTEELGSTEELGRQLIQGWGRRTDNNLTCDLAPEETQNLLNQKPLGDLQSHQGQLLYLPLWDSDSVG